MNEFNNCYQNNFKLKQQQESSCMSNSWRAFPKAFSQDNDNENTKNESNNDQMWLKIPKEINQSGWDPN